MIGLPARRFAVTVDSLLDGSSIALELLIATFSGRELDPAALPYRADVLEVLRKEEEIGTRLVLLAADNEQVARRVAKHLGIFKEVSLVDEKAWAPPPGARTVPAGAAFEALRPYQWLKNTLVFLPFLLAHEVAQADKWIAAGLLFVAFSLCASATYVINDIIDRAHDRRHPRRGRRPIASGALPLRPALWIPGPLLAAAGLCCAFLPPACALALGVYLAFTLLYSTAAKKLIMADVLLLAGLYLLRLIAGSAATGNVVSHWLMAFALTLFLSLALSKRVSELMAWRSVACEYTPGRAYRSGDAPILQMMAVASGFLACLVMVLYIQSPEILKLYRRPEYLWVGVVALLYWLGRLFVYAHRGECPDDPLFFALQDRPTLLLLLGAAAAAFLAV